MIRRWLSRPRKAELDCRAVGRVLQSYLDNEIDEDFAAKIESHLEACRACGLELETYQQIKTTLASRMPDVDPAAVERLRTFGAEITGHSDPG